MDSHSRYTCTLSALVFKDTLIRSIIFVIFYNSMRIVCDFAHQKKKEFSYITQRLLFISPVNL